MIAKELEQKLNTKFDLGTEKVFLTTKTVI